MFRSGRTCNNWDALLRLLVPTLEPSGRSSRILLFRDIKASRGSSLSGKALSISSSGNSAGTSFMLWTAAWTCFLRRASSISFTNSPFPPILLKGESKILSPVVLIFTSSTSTSVCLFSTFSLTHSLWARASLLPLVPILKIIIKFSFPSRNPLLSRKRTRIINHCSKKTGRAPCHQE